MDASMNFENIPNIPVELIIPLSDWYRTAARPLPWRESRDPYRIWLSEVMLQQTRIAAVLEYFARFTAELPDIASLAAADEERLLKLWQGLGYYNRARNLQKAAKILVSEYNGDFPRSYESIRRLPGIGEYTAGAIASIAFDLPVPAVDGNVLRVLTRILGDESDIAREDTKKRFRTALLPVLKKTEPGIFNQALMELGERICLPNGEPLCDKCPVSGLCMAHKEGRSGELPIKSSASARRIEERIVYLCFYENQVAIRKRPGKGLLAGLWEYPNEPADFDAFSEWGISPKETYRQVAAGKHVFSHIEWHMKALQVECKSSLLPQGWVWADRNALENYYAVPNAFRFAAEAVSRRLAEHGPVPPFSSTEKIAY